MRAKDFVTGNVAYNKTLCPVVWDNKLMRPEVRDKLLQIAEVFVSYLEIPNFEILDIVLAGSLANFNWTRHSDFDLHVVTRYNDLQCDDIAEAFYRAKKQIWNDAHDITIHGHEIELYVEDINEPPVSAGLFSVMDNKWLSVPRFSQPEINSGAVNHKVQDLIVQIKHAIRTADDPNDINRIRSKLRHMRQAGLDKGGEFSVENLAFKVLRNLGYLDKLSKAFLTQQDRDLSLVEDSDNSALSAMLDKFLPIAMDELKLDQLPEVVLQSTVESDNGQASFGKFNPEDQTISLAVSNRHPVDILRTLAHELVHYKQDLNGSMYSGAGETGSPIENQANEIAGVIMRHFNKAYPQAIEANAIK